MFDTEWDAGARRTTTARPRCSTSSTSATCSPTTRTRDGCPTRRMCPGRPTPRCARRPRTLPPGWALDCWRGWTGSRSRGLAGDAAVDAAVAFDRVANRVAARRMRAVATAVRRQLGTERVDPIRLASAELAAALALGSRSIGAEVTCALALTGPLTRTLAAMDTGAVSYAKARVLVEQTLDLFDEQAQAVEALVLDAAAGRTWAQHAAAVRRAVVRVDPGAPERRRKNAERASRLVRRYGDDGLAELIVTLPTAQVDAAYTAADAWARARKAAGDDRTLQMLRAAAIAQWATSYLTHGDPTTCDHTCDRVPTPDTGDAEPQVDPDTGEILDPSPP